MIRPSRKVKYLPTELSCSFICAVNFFSLSRALKDGWRLAVLRSMYVKTRSMIEKAMCASIDDFDIILSASVDPMSSSQNIAHVDGGLGEYLASILVLFSPYPFVWSILKDTP